MEQEENRQEEEVFSVEGNEDFSLKRAVEEVSGGASRPSDIKQEPLQEALLKKIEETEKKYLYLLADFENYKKRAQREQTEQAKFSNERLLKEVLVVLDDLERAILHSKEAENSAQIAEGVTLTAKQFLSFLARYSVKPIPCLNQPFDPVYHQSVGYVEKSGGEEGQVAEEIQRGYLIHDRVLRASLVRVLKKKPVVVEDRLDFGSVGGNVDRKM
jgi:molecular chaperone GrpE